MSQPQRSLVLAVLDWPTSPVAAHEKNRAGKLAAARAPRPAARVGYRSPVVLHAVGNDDFSAHVLEWGISQNRSKTQVVWEANRAALVRLRTCADWLHARFREAEVGTSTRYVGTPGEPAELQPSDWFCENAFANRFVTGRYDRWLPRMSRPTPVYIFVDRAGLEKAIATLAHADAIVSTTDLARCSPHLRFGVAFSLKHSAELAGYWKRPSLEAAIKEEWDKANPSEPMLPVAATRIGYVVYPPDPDATAQGQKGGTARKTGSTSKAAVNRTF